MILLGLGGLALSACGRPALGKHAEAALGGPASPATELVEALDATGPNSAWALTSRAVIRTNDAGTTWITASPRSTQPLVAPFFLDGSRAWAAADAPGDAVVVFRSRDGGLTWDRADLPVTYPDGFGQVNIDFVDADRGWITVQQPTGSAFAFSDLYSTTDGGATWQGPPAPALPFAGPLEFENDSVGWAIGAVNSAELLSTVDGGSSWQSEVPLPPSILYHSMTVGLPTFYDANHGVVEELLSDDLAAVRILVTNDGGATWSGTTTLEPPSIQGSDSLPPFQSFDLSHWMLGTPEISPTISMVGRSSRTDRAPGSSRAALRFRAC